MKLIACVLRWLIQKQYRQHRWKLWYARLLGSRIDADPFAKEHGVLETLSLGQNNRPLTIAREFVTRRFNQLAAHYNARVDKSGFHQGELGKLLQAVKDDFNEVSQPVSLLDLGCGTGLVGLDLKPRAARLVGVDISPNMIEVAARSGVYDELHEEDCISFLTNETRHFNLIIANSVAQFFPAAEIDQWMGLIAPRMTHDGALYFTFDICLEGCRMNYKLFCEHSPDLILSLGRKHFKVCNIIPIPNGRREQGMEVNCGLAVCRKPVSGS